MNIIEDYRPAGFEANRLWRTDLYDMDKGSDIARYIARHPYAWPGGYDMFAVTDDGGILCPTCCKSEYRNIKTAYPGDGWSVVAYDICYGTGGEDDFYTCDHCNTPIGV